MGIPAILGVSTGVPSTRYSQAAIAEYYIQLLNYEPRRARAIRSIFERSGVGFRHMIVDEQYFLQERRTSERNDLYMQEAVKLGEATIRQGLESAGLQADQIDELVIVSCTGWNTPGLDLILAGRLGMRPDLQRTSILGMGCYGAFPGMRRARHAAMGEQDSIALVLSLELCSLHMQFDESSDTVVSSALFSDGASMALIGMRGDNGKRPMPRLLHAATFCDYQTLDHMTFRITDHGFRMSLSSYVPQVLNANIEAFVDSMLAVCGIKRADVRLWGIHPGGSSIINGVQKQLGLTDAQVEHSHYVLYEYGNMSSASILFVLDRLQRCEQPGSGDYGVLLAFGPGLTMEGLVLQW